jgi:hypothetical protein
MGVWHCPALQNPGGRGVGVAVGQNPAMKLFPSSQILLNAVMGQVEQTGWDGIGLAPL